MRRRIAFAIAVAAGAPAAAVAYGLVSWLPGELPLGASIVLALSWTVAVTIVAWLYGSAMAARLVAPLEALTGALRRFDPSLGDVGDAALVDLDGEPEETIALKRALRQAVERIARDRSEKEAVLGGLMHDLKTPVVAQNLLVERLKAAPDDDREAVVRELERSSVGTLARLNRLIDVLRVDSAAAYGARGRHDLHTVVEAVVADLSILMRSRGVEVEVGGAWSGEFDLMAVRRAVENVVVNAIRHASRRVRVGVSAGLVRVVDDGPGFAAPFDELLDPFRPGPASPGVAPGAAGLGLYIARRSLEAGGGRLKLEASGPGHTSVLLYLGTGGS